MRHWTVEKTGNGYSFHTLEVSLKYTGINHVNIYINPVQGLAEIHAYTYDTNRYRGILDAGIKHSAGSASAKSDEQSRYFFDSTHDCFANKTEEMRDKILSDSVLMMSYKESSLSHVEPFDTKDPMTASKNLTDSLAVLAKVDGKVNEVVEYMKAELMPDLAPTAGPGGGK